MGYVYKITNTINGKAYIGISIHEPEKKRIKDHLSGRGSRLIAAAVKKYGKDAFTYEILEANVFDEFLPELEVAYIAKFNTVSPNGYNLTSGGDQGVPSSESRCKMSEAHKGKPRDDLKGENHHFFGKKLSSEHRRKISEAHKGEKHYFYGKRHSIETRIKISKSRTGKNTGEKHPLFGKSLPGETTLKISKANKGRKLSAKTRRKMSESKKGEKHPLFGKSRSTETRRKIHEANRHPDYALVQEYFFSLYPEMPLREKNRLMYTKFPDINKRTIRGWTQKWVSDD